ncbi:uncharacterized protein BDV14DRAFT_206105 [Aspergillus stella-maris]|uniref:uncharacterized protein n=1 Tax=Aspergillus stella-maris TaxID=1810926 RepID=UPI003CCCAAAF
MYHELTSTKPTTKISVAIYGGDGKYGLLEAFRDLEVLGYEREDACFSTESAQTKHGLTVNYAKYEYVEKFRELQGVDGPFETKYRYALAFIEFATWGDALKATFDSFPIPFSAFIYSSLADPEGSRSMWGLRGFAHRFRNVLLDREPRYHDIVATAWIPNVDADEHLPTRRDSFGGERDELKVYSEIAESFRCMDVRCFHIIKAPTVDSWKWVDGAPEGSKTNLWLCQLEEFLREIIPARDEAPDHWNRPRRTPPGRFDRRYHYEKFTVNLYVLTEDEGGAPIAHDDHRTFTDGPAEIEGSIAAKKTLLPGQTGEVTVTLPKESEWLDIGAHLIVKQDGRLVAVGIQTDWPTYYKD